MKKVYETPMTDVYVVDPGERLCDTVITPTGPTDDLTNERNTLEDTNSEEIWNKEW